MNALIRTQPSRAVATARVRVAQTNPEPAQYLTFMLAGELFAIGILAIKEIIEYNNVTEVPMMPVSVRGVINLRGALVPVVDLLARFGRSPSATTKRSCIVVVEVDAGEEPQVVGLMVDVVNEVRDIALADIEPPPTFGARMRSDFIHGMGKVNGKLVILLDVNRALSVDELDRLGGTAVSSTGTPRTETSDA